MEIRIGRLCTFTLVSLLSLFGFAGHAGAQGYTFNQLYSFCSATNCADGGFPFAGLTPDAEGNLLGTTKEEGANGNGTVYKLDSTGRETVLYSFCSDPNCTDGVWPVAGLIQDAEGNLYGTTEYGGANNNGTIFKVGTTGQETVLYSFCSEGADHCTDGQIPRAGLVQDTAGNLYGTTEGGGSGTGDNGYGGGTVFKLDSTGHETVLYSFCSEGGAKCTDGNYPYAGLIQDAAGNLYGTTWEGGANSEYGGTLFKVDNTGHETMLYSFCAEGGSKCTDGAQPSGGLIRDAAGNLYGTTNFGGTNGLGAVFKLDGTGHETVLYSFCPGGNPCKDGSVPSAALIQDAAGNLYGTTEYGGTNGPDGGTVFKLDSTGHETVLYSFCSEGGSKCTDGEGPLAGLIQDAAGDLYGTTWEGGAKGDGTVFKLAREKACVDASRSLCK
jgi:uncharacterized repeat protein (TIGR03803 family)